MTGEERAAIREELQKQTRPTEDQREFECRMEIATRIAAKHEEALRELSKR